MYIEYIEIAEKIVADHKAQYKGVYVMFGGGGTTSSTQNTSPWSGQQGYLTNQYQNAANLYLGPNASSILNGQGGTPSQQNWEQLYPGATSGSEITPFNQQEQSSLGSLYNTGMNSPLINQTANTQQAILSGQMLGAGNPYQANELSALNAQVTPQIESQFTQGNAMNNPAAAYATSQGIGAADSQILGQNYNTGLNQITQESALTPQTYNAQLGGLNSALGAGQAQQNQQQNVLNSEIGAYNYNQQLPYQMLNQYITQTSGNPGSSSVSQQPYYTNPFSNIASLGTTALAANQALPAGYGAVAALAAL